MGVSIIAGTVLFVAQNTIQVPASGGTIVYGIAGQPLGINPILATSETDKTLLRFTFSPLENFSEEIQSNKDATEWTVRLREGITWQDGQRISSDDIVFTVQKIQEAQRRSPLFSSWQGVTAKRVSEREIRFILPVPYVFFENTLKNLYPLPQHLFGAIPVSNWPLSQYNFKPTGNGPYILNSSEVGADGFIRSMTLTKNSRYYKKNSPYISKVLIKFFPTREAALTALNEGKIDVLSDLSPQEFRLIKRPVSEVNFPIENYYAVFMNPGQHPALEDRRVREALNTSIDREQITESVFGEYATPRFLPANTSSSYSPGEIFNTEQAEDLLDQAGWLKNPFGQREKLIRGQVIPLSLKLYVPRVPFLEQTATFLKEAWGGLGINLVVELRDPGDIASNVLVSRDYQLLLFGNILSPAEDLYPYWHSSAALHPGLNLSSYRSPEVDELLSTTRRTLNETARDSLLKEINKKIFYDSPAVFLFSTDFLLATSKHVQGIRPFELWEPTDHLRQIDEWFVKTTRVLNRE